MRRREEEKKRSRIDEHPPRAITRKVEGREEVRKRNRIGENPPRAIEKEKMRKFNESTKPRLERGQHLRKTDQYLPG